MKYILVIPLFLIISTSYASSHNSIIFYSPTNQNSKINVKIYNTQCNGWCRWEKGGNGPVFSGGTFSLDKHFKLSFHSTDKKQGQGNESSILITDAATNKKICLITAWVNLTQRSITDQVYIAKSWENKNYFCSDECYHRLVKYIAIRKKI